MSARRGWRIAVLLALAPALHAQSQPDTGAGRATASDETPRDARARRLAAWREALELDLAPQVIEEARVLLAPGAPSAADGELLALFARATFAIGDEQTALALCERKASDAEGALALQLARARFEIERDELAPALKRLTSIETRDPGDDERHPERLLLLGRALVRAARGSEARALLERFVALAPLDVEAPAALHMLAQLALERRELGPAAELRERARQSSLWQSYFKTRRLQVREHPDDPLPRLGICELWLAAGAAAGAPASIDNRARAALSELTALFPDFARGWSLSGDFERARGRLDGARAAYARALALDAELPEARVGRARLALAEKRLADARADLEWLVASRFERDERFLAAHLELARVLAELGLVDAARARFAVYRERGGREALEREAKR